MFGLQDCFLAYVDIYFCVAEYLPTITISLGSSILNYSLCTALFIGLQDCFWQMRNSTYHLYAVARWDLSGNVWQPTPTHLQIFKALSRIYDPYKDVETLAYEFREEIHGCQGLSLAWDTQTKDLEYSPWYDVFAAKFHRGKSIYEVESRLQFQSPEHDPNVYHFYVIWEGHPFPTSRNNYVALELLIGPHVQREQGGDYGWDYDGPSEDPMQMQMDDAILDGLRYP